jgi:hypothetical protein
MSERVFMITVVNMTKIPRDDQPAEINCQNFKLAMVISLSEMSSTNLSRDLYVIQPALKSLYNIQERLVNGDAE